ncbi:MAG: hypothetical protein WEB30_18110 [Cyclobacteriaceae bacterium]
MKGICIVNLLIILSGNYGLGQNNGPVEIEFNGRIAWSADGNFNDEDDWAASPVALAIFAELGVKVKVVHFDYNCIIPMTNKEWAQIHETSVLGAAERYGFPKSIFHDVQKDLDGAVNSIANAINASSEENPLYFVLAGPMEVPALGIQKADPEKRKFVYCISHNIWNDGYASGDLVEHNKRDVIPLGVNWIQITDQNKFLSTGPYGIPSKEEEWKPWHWMRDSKDPKVRFLWERMQVSTRADCSDAGMAYFLIMGDEEPDHKKLKYLLDDKKVASPVDRRKRVRLEAENFTNLRDFEVEYIGDREASQQMSVKYSGKAYGQISTHFREIHVPESSHYDIDVRILYGPDRKGEYELYINGGLKSTYWTTTNLRRWQTKTFRNIPVKLGDEITIKVKSDMPGGIKLDYVELTDPVQKR